MTMRRFEKADTRRLRIRREPCCICPICRKRGFSGTMDCESPVVRRERVAAARRAQEQRPGYAYGFR